MSVARLRVERISAASASRRAADAARARRICRGPPDPIAQDHSPLFAQSGIIRKFAVDPKLDGS